MFSRRHFATLLGLGVLACQPLFAAPAPYDFKDPKGVNAVSFTLDSEVEPIIGYATGISGEVSFDPEKPEATTGSIIVDANTLAVSHSMMTEHMKSEGWMDVAQYPTISFVFKQVVKAEQKSDARWTLTVKGDFTVHGVTQEMTVPVDVSHLPGKASIRFGDKVKGDLLVVRASFVVNRKTIGVKPDLGPEKVAQDIRVDVGIVGLNKP